MDARGRRLWCDLAYLVAAGVTVVAGGRHDRRTQLVAKPLLMPLLALGELSDADRRADRVDAGLLAVGLAAATAGDVHMIDIDDDAALRRGASCFAVMQVCWWLRAHRTGAVPGAAQIVPRAIAWSIASIATARRLPTPAPVLIGYGALLAGAGATADAVGGRTATGGRLFTLSDTTVLVRRMLIGGPAGDPHSRTARLLEAFVLATYAGAQYLLVRPAPAGSTPAAT